MTKQWPDRRVPKTDRRGPTPPPLRDPPLGEEDDWFHSGCAGGRRLHFGKFKGQTLNETSLSYLIWCRRTFTDAQSYFCQALETYLDGLERYADTHYGDFVVPFGRTYQGLKISQCRDKGWLEWTLYDKRVEYLTEKYPIYFRAVKNWLDNPRHQGVKRDIGEVLAPSNYGDEVDLKGHSDVPNESDLDFIDDSEIKNGKPVDWREAYMAGQAGIYRPQTPPNLCQDASDSEDECSTPRDQIEHEACEGKVDDDEGYSSDTDDSSDAGKNSDVELPGKKTPRRKNKTESDGLEEFIEIDDDEADASDFYETPEATPAFNTPRRETRASARKEAEKEAVISSLQRKKRFTKRRRESSASEFPEGSGMDERERLLGFSPLPPLDIKDSAGLLSDVHRSFLNSSSQDPDELPHIWRRPLRSSRKRKYIESSDEEDEYERTTNVTLDDGDEDMQSPRARRRLSESQKEVLGSDLDDLNMTWSASRKSVRSPVKTRRSTCSVL